MENNQMISTFNRFAEMEAKDNSPLYEFWCHRIVQDDFLLDLIEHIPKAQPKPNLFFASVQYLVLRSKHPLAHCFLYPEETEFETSLHLLKDFCKENKHELIQLFQTKKVQTNEVQRAAYLYLILHEIFKRSKKPLTLIEIGTSAGLLLNLDHYQYVIHQSDSIQYGDKGSSLQIHAKNLGDTLIGVDTFEIKNRLGIDLNIIDLNVDEDFYWLQCLIWPEQPKRKENLKKAREIHLNCEKTLLEGDFRKLIPKYIDELKEESQIVLFHTHVANQFPSELKADLLTMINHLSSKIPIYHVYNNLYDQHLHVDYIYKSKTTNLKVLKNTDGHGRYFYWS